MVANHNRLEVLSEPEDRPERASQADVVKAASMADLEAHRLLTLVRQHYGCGSVAPADAWDVVEALGQAGEILRRQRQFLLESSRNSLKSS